MDTTLEYFGVSGGAISIIGMLVFAVKRLLTSNCVRGNDRNMRLEVSLNNSELTAIRQNEDLKQLLQQLKQEIARKTDTPAA